MAIASFVGYEMRWRPGTKVAVFQKGILDDTFYMTK